MEYKDEYFETLQFIERHNRELLRLEGVSKEFDKILSFYQNNDFDTLKDDLIYFDA